VPVVAWQKLSHEIIVGLVEVIDALQLEFVTKAILKRAPQSLDSTFGLRAVRGNPLDAQLLERSTELR
jgi:hypothetical protein